MPLLTVRIALLLVLSLLSIAIASACQLSPRDIEAFDEPPSSVWRSFWKELSAVDDVAAGASTDDADPTATTRTSTTPQPPLWPEVFHALLVQRRNGTSSIVDLYYDWKKKRNANLIRRQLDDPGETLYDIEHNNGTSFYFTRPSSPGGGDDAGSRRCKEVSFPVGILPPDWLRGARYLGRLRVDGFECHGWAKGRGRPSNLDFVHYYARASDGVPVRWKFFVGEPMEMDVMSFSVARRLSEDRWQAPSWCFDSARSEIEKEGEGGAGSML